MNLKQFIRKTLEDKPHTRNCDNDLILEVFREYGASDKFLVEFKALSFEMPTFEGITRARRKTQELNPELRATKEVEIYREGREEDFINGKYS